MRRIEETCGPLHQAAHALFGQGHVEAAVGKLVECTVLLPDEFGAFWEVAMLLHHLEAHQDALIWLQNAIAVGLQNDPTSVQARHYQAAASTAHLTAEHVLAVKLQETALEVALKLVPGTWTATLETAALATNRAELEWMFGAGEELTQDPTDLFQRLASSYYIDAHDRKSALLAFTVLQLLHPDNPAVHFTKGTYLLNMGKIKDGLQMQLDNTIRSLVEVGKTNLPTPNAAVRTASKVAHHNMVLLLTTSLEQTTILIVRGLLRRELAENDPQLLPSLATECNVQVHAPADGVIPMEKMRSLVGACIQQQGVVEAAVAAEGSINAANAFGYRPLHHAGSSFISISMPASIQGLVLRLHSCVKTS